MAKNITMLNVGPVTFHLYGVILATGMAVAAVVAEMWRKKLAKKDKAMGKFNIWDGLWWMLLLGLVGGRAYHVVDFWEYYSVNPIKALYLWEGGMGIFGAMVGVLVGAFVYVRRKDLWLKLVDLVALGAPLGQAIGRWGNYVNQELYGRPTDLPWGIYIRPENRPLMFLDRERFQPLFFYEFLWNLAVFFLLNWLVLKGKIKIGRGRVFLAYLALYGVGRFFLEFLKLEAWVVGGVNVAQAISLTAVGVWATVHLIDRR